MAEIRQDIVLTSSFSLLERECQVAELRNLPSLLGLELSDDSPTTYVHEATDNINQRQSKYRKSKLVDHGRAQSARSLE